MVWFSCSQIMPILLASLSVTVAVSELQLSALRIFQVCVRFGISLDIKWIPRKSNLEADRLRQIIDFDYYALNDDVFLD